MTDNPETWNKAYATALREFAANTEAKLKAGYNPTAIEIVKGLHMYADAIWPISQSAINNLDKGANSEAAR